MAFGSIKEIIEVSDKKKKLFWEMVIEDSVAESEETKDALFLEMTKMWNTMEEASRDYDGSLHSRSGLVGGDGEKMKQYTEKRMGYSDLFLGTVITEAIQMGESNACMGRIVAAPTAGSCGVLPAVLLAAKKVQKMEEEAIVESMFVAAGIGQVIAKRAFIAGAAGGCQAEIGAASAMAAGALVFLKGGNAEQISHGVAMALKNLLGLVCDPVAGLVEVPCVKRNVIGATNAVSCAEMALAGIESAIPADQVIDAMREIGDDMSSRYKETAGGGCATTPRGQEIAKEFLGE